MFTTYHHTEFNEPNSNKPSVIALKLNTASRQPRCFTFNGTSVAPTSEVRVPVMLLVLMIRNLHVPGGL